MTRKAGPNRPGLSGLLLVTLLVSASAFDNSVYIQSHFRQKVTSSTLNWLPIAHYVSTKDIVTGGLAYQRDSEGVENGNYNESGNAVTNERLIFVCRVNHNGVMVAGKQLSDEKRCTVTYLGNVASYTRYDLLENVDNSARLRWVTWDKFHQTPLGAVAAGKTFVARHVAEEKKGAGANTLFYTHYIGTYDSSEGFGKITYVKDDGKEGTAESGEILVETEAIFYELNAVKLNVHRTRIIKRTPKILKETTISNTRSEPADLAEALGYTFNYSIYWGQGHAMIKALNTSITKVEGTKLGYISWGLDSKSVRSNATTVEIHLEPGTAVNVTLKANYTDMEIPYTAELVSIYEDLERKTRVVSGMCREETMTDVKVEFGPIYFIGNLSLAPTTLPPPSTVPLTTTSTTSKQPESTSAKESTHSAPGYTPEIDENLIVPPRNSDPSNAQNNDDGGPLSLKDKVEASQTLRNLATSLAFKPSLTVLAIAVVAFYRIT